MAAPDDEHLLFLSAATASLAWLRKNQDDLDQETYEFVETQLGTESEDGIYQYLLRKNYLNLVKAAKTRPAPPVKQFAPPEAAGVAAADLGSDYHLNRDTIKNLRMGVSDEGCQFGHSFMGNYPSGDASGFKIDLQFFRDTMVVSKWPAEAAFSQAFCPREMFQQLSRNPLDFLNPVLVEGKGCQEFSDHRPSLFQFVFEGSEFTAVSFNALSSQYLAMNFMNTVPSEESESALWQYLYHVYRVYYGNPLNDSGYVDFGKKFERLLNIIMRLKYSRYDQYSQKDRLSTFLDALTHKQGLPDFFFLQEFESENVSLLVDRGYVCIAQNGDDPQDQAAIFMLRGIGEEQMTWRPLPEEEDEALNSFVRESNSGKPLAAVHIQSHDAKTKLALISYHAERRKSQQFIAFLTTCFPAPMLFLASGDANAVIKEEDQAVWENKLQTAFSWKTVPYWRDESSSFE